MYQNSMLTVTNFLGKIFSKKFSNIQKEWIPMKYVQEIKIFYIIDYYKMGLEWGQVALAKYLSPDLPYQLVVDDVHLTYGCRQDMYVTIVV